MKNIIKSTITKIYDTKIKITCKYCPKSHKYLLKQPNQKNNRNKIKLKYIK